MSQLIIISNRLPLSVRLDDEGLSYCQSMGGLATGLSAYHQNRESVWIGWSGLPKDRTDERIRKQIDQTLWNENRCRSIHLSEDELEHFYYGFCNRTLWPLFHNFPTFVAYNEKQWNYYQRINESFKEIVLEHAGPKDTIWVHDYHLMLLPGMLRDALPDAKIGFFLHIPFPSYEILRLLPWRKEILHGLMGASLVGFHTLDYVNHFYNSVRRLINLEHSFGQYILENHVLNVDAFPMGIDYDRFARETEPDETIQRMTAEWSKNMRIILSVDRLDYTKGILHRLEAFDRFLENHPEYHKNVMMILIAVPSRTRVISYQELKEQMDQTIGRINGKYGELGWMPVWYFYRGFPLDELIQLYRLADVALITPIRDGMNLIAKEFIASQTGKQGGLVLSEMAGASGELPEALIVNPNNISEVAEAIYEALEMPEETWRQRNGRMRNRIRRYTIFTWVRDFMQHLESAVAQDQEISAHRFGSEAKKKLIRQYEKSIRRFLVFDMDELLISDSLNAALDKQTDFTRVIKHLARSQNNEVVVLSGMDQEQLGSIFEDSPVHLYASLGAWVREFDSEWHEDVRPDTAWKRVISPILELFVQRTPGSYLETRNYSLLWHYEKTEHQLQSQRTAELKSTLIGLIANHDVKMRQGASCIEIRSSSLSKAKNISFWLSNQYWDFILAVGDDWTEDDVFRSLPSSAFTIKIGSEWGKARYWTSDSEKVYAVLARLAGEGL